jgi:hypothetical protein
MHHCQNFLESISHLLFPYVHGVSKRALQLWELILIYWEDTYSALNCQQNTPNFTWDSYGLMWLPLVMQGVSKRALQCYSKCYCVVSVTKTLTLEGVQTIHRSRCRKNSLHSIIWNTIVKVFLKHSVQERIWVLNLKSSGGRVNLRRIWVGADNIKLNFKGTDCANINCINLARKEEKEIHVNNGLIFILGVCILLRVWDQDRGVSVYATIFVAFNITLYSLHAAVVWQSSSGHIYIVN